MRRRRILMCPPDHYGIEYEINAWMSRGRQADGKLAAEQWEGLKRALESAGAEIELLPSVAGFPDLVFTANAGLVFKNRVILASFRPNQRRGEQPLARTWFEQHGFEVELLPDDLFFEGAGDALFCGDTLIAGYRMRSDARAHQTLAEMLGCRVIPLELVEPHYYHLDTCFCPLSEEVALYYPAAFDDYGRQALEAAIPTLIEIPANEAVNFAANAVVVYKTVVTNVGCPVVHERLEAAGFHPVATPLNEFVKAGGSAKCLTLRLDGEEAAAWAREA